MSLTPEERAERSRQNGRKSHGPTTHAGKQRSRANAMKHGLRADALPIPGEDPALAQSRTDAWNEYYAPQSPASQHLVNECVRATLQADRVANCHAVAIAAHMKEARASWYDRQEKAATEQGARLRTNPADAYAQLVSTAAGCRWLIARWERLEHALQTYGRWKHGEAAIAVRMLGGMTDNPDAWVARLCAARLGGSDHYDKLHPAVRSRPTAGELVRFLQSIQFAQSHRIA